MKQMTIRIDDETYEKLAYVGDHLGIPTATVARMWLKQRSDEEFMPPQAPRKKKDAPTVRRKNPEGTRSQRRTNNLQQDPADSIAEEIRQVSRWDKK